MTVAQIPTMRTLFAQVAAEYRLTEAELREHRNLRRISWPRQDFMWRARQVTRSDGQPRYSLPQIGRFLGGFDHTTVKHGVERHAIRQVVARNLGIEVADLRFIQKNRRLGAWSSTSQETHVDDRKCRSA